MREMDWKAFAQWAAERLEEKSTWAGIIAIVTPLSGFVVPADQAAAITSVGMAVAGAVLVFTKSKGPTP
jgi:hypothetical protein